MNSVKTIPYGVSDFANMRRRNGYYVDNTWGIPLLEALPYQLFVRPRRFGKSLLLSILHYYYDVNETERFDELFAGTWIYENPTPSRGKYLVLHFDFSKVAGEAWIGFPVRREMTVLGVDFSNGGQIWSAIIAIVPIALATIMEHIGDISAISSTVGRDFIKDPGLHRTLTGDGLATTFASLFGGPANTTYGENTGVLALSRVFNPVVVRIAAVFAILLSFCPKFAALIATIPGPIVGGISFVLYGMISAVGIRNLVENHVDFSKSRNLIIAAVILVTALGGVTLPLAIGKFHAVLSPLAVASLAGIVLNAIFPAGDYAARAAEDEPPKGNTFEV